MKRTGSIRSEANFGNVGFHALEQQSHLNGPDQFGSRLRRQRTNGRHPNPEADRIANTQCRLNYSVVQSTVPLNLKKTVLDWNTADVPLVKASEQIRRAALSWSGVTTQAHRFGGAEYRLGRREIGHVHGDYLVDIPFPKNVRNELVAAGLAEPHHILPNSGWVSFYIKRADQVDQAIALLRRSYDLAISRKSGVK